MGLTERGRLRIYSCCLSGLFRTASLGHGVIAGNVSRFVSFRLKQKRGSEIALFKTCWPVPPASHPGSSSSFLPYNWSSRCQVRRRGLSCEACWSPGEGEELLSGRRLHNAGQALYFVVMVSQKPEGPIQGNAHVPLLYPLFLLKGISFPLLFSIVDILSQVPRTRPESERLPTHGTFHQRGGEVPSLVHTQVFVPVPDDSIVISSFFWCSCFVSKTRKRSCLRDRCLDET